MFKVNDTEATTTTTVSLFLTLSLTLRILVSLLLTSNVFHILHDVKNVEIRALYWKKKEKKLSLTDYKFANWSVVPPKYKPRPLGDLTPSIMQFSVSSFDKGLFLKVDRNSIVYYVIFNCGSLKKSSLVLGDLFLKVQRNAIIWFLIFNCGPLILVLLLF